MVEEVVEVVAEGDEEVVDVEVEVVEGVGRSNSNSRMR